MPEPVLTESQTKELSEIVVVANTPACLARRLRENGIVESMSRAHTARELLGYAQKVFTDSKARLTLASSALVYAALVAAMMRPADEFANAQHELGAPKIRWAEDLMKQAAETPSTNTRTIVVTGKVDVSSRSAPPSNKPIGRPLGNFVVE